MGALLAESWNKGATAAAAAAAAVTTTAATAAAAAATNGAADDGDDDADADVTTTTCTKFVLCTIILWRFPPSHHSIEPHIHPDSCGALFSPDAGTLIPYEYTIALAEVSNPRIRPRPP